MHYHPFFYIYIIFTSGSESEFTNVDLLSTQPIMNRTLQLRILFFSFSSNDMKKDIQQKFESVISTFQNNKQSYSYNECIQCKSISVRKKNHRRKKLQDGLLERYIPASLDSSRYNSVLYMRYHSEGFPSRIYKRVYSKSCSGKNCDNSFIKDLFFCCTKTLIITLQQHPNINVVAGFQS